jgi:hypothetical protein
MGSSLGWILKPAWWWPHGVETCSCLILFKVVDGYLFVPCFVGQHSGMHNFKNKIVQWMMNLGGFGGRCPWPDSNTTLVFAWGDWWKLQVLGGLAYPSFCPHRKPRLLLDEFSWNMTLNIFKNSVEKLQVSLKSDKNNGCFTWIPI